MSDKKKKKGKYYAGTKKSKYFKSITKHPLTPFATTMSYPKVLSSALRLVRRHPLGMAIGGALSSYFLSKDMKTKTSKQNKRKGGIIMGDSCFRNQKD